MATSRIEVFEQMLASDPANTMVLFGLAKEYEKTGDDAKVIETLERYLTSGTPIAPMARRTRTQVLWRQRDARSMESIFNKRNGRES